MLRPRRRDDPVIGGIVVAAFHVKYREMLMLR
jgi:hypothetical protein